MKFEFKYRNDDERAIILDENKDKYLIKEKNITEGNFLVFTDVKPIEIELQETKQAVSDTNAMVLEFMEVIAVGGI